MAGQQFVALWLAIRAFGLRGRPVVALGVVVVEGGASLRFAGTNLTRESLVAWGVAVAIQAKLSATKIRVAPEGEV